MYLRGPLLLRLVRVVAEGALPDPLFWNVARYFDMGRAHTTAWHFMLGDKENMTGTRASQCTSIGIEPEELGMVLVRLKYPWGRCRNTIRK